MDKPKIPLCHPANAEMVWDLKPTATITVVTDRTAEVRSLMNLQGKTRSESSKGPRDSFIVLLRFLAFEMVHLLLHTDNGTLLFYHTSQVLNKLTRAGDGAWVADSLSRDRVGASNTVVNFPPPDDLSNLLQFTDCVMVKKSLLAKVEVTLKNREAAASAIRGIQPYRFLIGHDFFI